MIWGAMLHTTVSNSSRAVGNVGLRWYSIPIERIDSLSEFEASPTNQGTPSTRDVTGKKTPTRTVDAKVLTDMIYKRGW